MSQDFSVLYVAEFYLEFTPLIRAFFSAFKILKLFLEILTEGIRRDGYSLNN